MASPWKSKDPIHNINHNTASGKPRAAKRIYTVWIVPTDNDKWNMYFCPDCKTPIAQYKGDLVAEIPGEAPKPYPVMIQCKNVACGRKILFKEATEQITYE